MTSRPDNEALSEADPTDREKELIEAYNSFEQLYKRVQLVRHIFAETTLNEIRYFSRAFVDARDAVDDPVRQDRAYSRAEMALSAATTDVLDALVTHVLETVGAIRAKYLHAQVATHLDELGYLDKVIPALKAARNLIVDTRYDRHDRLQRYIKFCSSDEFVEIARFAFALEELELRCDSDRGFSARRRKLDLLKDVRAALNNKNDDKKLPTLHLLAQPKYRVAINKAGQKSRRIFGAECLIRLKKPDLEHFVGPNVFLPAVDTANLSHDLGLWVARTAAKALAGWKKKFDLPIDFDLSINVSPRLSEDTTYVDQFAQIARSNGVIQMLSIEITEDWMQSGSQHQAVSQNIQRLPEKTKIAVDDFGTGSTKISYLAEIHGLSSIKIDKSLVDLLFSRTDERARFLIAGINALAVKNNLGVIAEGVETDEQEDALYDIGIRDFQGYVLSRPLIFEQFEENFLIKRE